MTSLYESIAAEPDGPRRLAAAHARQDALRLLQTALDAASLTKSELATRLSVRKSAVGHVLNGNGNVTINTLSDYLFEAGCRLRLQATEIGSDDRGADVARRWTTSTKIAYIWTDGNGVNESVGSLQHDQDRVLLDVRMSGDDDYQSLVERAEPAENDLVNATG